MLGVRQAWTVRLLAVALLLGGLRDPRLFAVGGGGGWGRRRGGGQDAAGRGRGPRGGGAGDRSGARLAQRDDGADPAVLQLHPLRPRGRDGGRRRLGAPTPAG